MPMRTKFLIGLTVLSGSAVIACSEKDVTTPTRRLTPTISLTGDPVPPPPCDPTKQVCTSLDGRMTGGGGQIIIGDMFVSRGFTIHCDLLLSNDLEVNWPGNKWHIDKPLTSALCIDDPDISPEPPPAPFDTFIGEGIGKLNGVDGSLIKFTFVDAGEPGGKNDRAKIQIFAPDGTLVLDVPMSFLDRGNIQAHDDQPHR